MCSEWWSVSGNIFHVATSFLFDWLRYFSYKWNHPAEHISNSLKRRLKNLPHSPFFCLEDPLLHSSLAPSLLTRLRTQQKMPSDITIYCISSVQTKKQQTTEQTTRPYRQLGKISGTSLAFFATNRGTHLGVQLSLDLLGVNQRGKKD